MKQVLGKIARELVLPSRHTAIRHHSLTRVFDFRKTQVLLPGIVGVLIGFVLYAALDGKFSRSDHGIQKVDALVTHFNPGSATLVSCCYQGWAGMMFTTGDESLTITHLGRWMIRGNQQTHILKLVEARTKLDVPGSSVTLSLAGRAPDRFHYAALAKPLTLPPKRSYYLVSSERATNNQHELFFGHDSVITASILTVDKPVLWRESGWMEIAYPSASYGPVSFLYIVR